MDPVIAADVAQKNDKLVGQIASKFFDALIRQYDPLVASASEQANLSNTTPATGVEGAGKNNEPNTTKPAAAKTVDS